MISQNSQFLHFRQPSFSYQNSEQCYVCICLAVTICIVTVRHIQTEHYSLHSIVNTWLYIYVAIVIIMFLISYDRTHILWY